MNLEEWLEQEEGFRPYAYQDSTPEKFWTIGFGRLIDQRRGGGISHDEALYLLRNDVEKVKKALMSALDWAGNLDDVRQSVLIALAFQLGLGGMLGFHRMLTAVHDQNWELAAQELLNSKVATQAPARMQRAAEMLRTGAWPT